MCLYQTKQYELIQIGTSESFTSIIFPLMSNAIII